MTFWDHLDALRGVLFRMAATLTVAAIAMFCLMPRIFDSVIQIGRASCKERV